MTRSDLLSRLDRLVASRSILRHPFYRAWERGALTRAQLATYARVYYPHVRAFPEHLRSAAAGADDPAVRAELEANLADELSNPKPHAELWLDFAEALGADRRDVADAAPAPAAREAVETFGRLARRDAASGLAAFYAYESQQPEVSRAKMAGLREHYGVRDEDGLAYFDVHAVADVRHREGERAALARCLESGADPDVIIDAAGEALGAYWGLLDGVCDEAGMERRRHVASSPAVATRRAATFESPSR